MLKAVLLILLIDGSVARLSSDLRPGEDCEAALDRMYEAAVEANMPIREAAGKCFPPPEDEAAA